MLRARTSNQIEGDGLAIVPIERKRNNKVRMYQYSHSDSWYVADWSLE